MTLQPHISDVNLYLLLLHGRKNNIFIIHFTIFLFHPCQERKRKQIFLTAALQAKTLNTSNPIKYFTSTAYMFGDLLQLFLLSPNQINVNNLIDINISSKRILFKNLYYYEEMHYFISLVPLKFTLSQIFSQLQYTFKGTREKITFFFSISLLPVKLRHDEIFSELPVLFQGIQTPLTMIEQ